MNLVDSCGWIEFFTGGENADFFAEPLSDPENLLVPSVCVYEVFRYFLRTSGEAGATEALGAMVSGKLAALAAPMAASAARLSVQFGLPLADSIVFATAQKYDAVIWTQDKHFQNLQAVRYIEKAN